MVDALPPGEAKPGPGENALGAAESKSGKDANKASEGKPFADPKKAEPVTKGHTADRTDNEHIKYDKDPENGKHIVYYSFKPGKNFKKAGDTLYVAATDEEGKPKLNEKGEAVWEAKDIKEFTQEQKDKLQKDVLPAMEKEAVVKFVCVDDMPPNEREKVSKVHLNFSQATFPQPDPDKKTQGLTVTWSQKSAKSAASADVMVSGDLTKEQLFSTMAHETMHGLGCQHPGDCDCKNGERKNGAEGGFENKFTQKDTVMTYNKAKDADGREIEVQQLGTHDVAALQTIFGASQEARASLSTGKEGAAGAATAKGDGKETVQPPKKDAPQDDKKPFDPQWKKSPLRIDDAILDRDHTHFSQTFDKEGTVRLAGPLKLDWEGGTGEWTLTHISIAVKKDPNDRNELPTYVHVPLSKPHTVGLLPSSRNDMAPAFYDGKAIQQDLEDTLKAYQEGKLKPQPAPTSEIKADLSTIFRDMKRRYETANDNDERVPYVLLMQYAERRDKRKWNDITPDEQLKYLKGSLKQQKWNEIVALKKTGKSEPEALQTVIHTMAEQVRQKSPEPRQPEPEKPKNTEPETPKPEPKPEAEKPKPEPEPEKPKPEPEKLQPDPKPQPDPKKDDPKKNEPPTTPPPKENEFLSFLDQNKGKGIGGIIGTIIGWLVGGPIGALIGALIFGFGGHALVDSKNQNVTHGGPQAHGAQRQLSPQQAGLLKQLTLNMKNGDGQGIANVLREVNKTLDPASHKADIEANEAVAKKFGNLSKEQTISEVNRLAQRGSQMARRPVTAEEIVQLAASEIAAQARAGKMNGENGIGGANPADYGSKPPPPAVPAPQPAPGVRAP